MIVDVGSARVGICACRCVYMCDAIFGWDMCTYSRVGACVLHGFQCSMYICLCIYVFHHLVVCSCWLWVGLLLSVVIVAFVESYCVLEIISFVHTCCDTFILHIICNISYVLNMYITLC